MKKVFWAVLMLTAAASGIFCQSGIIRELTGTVAFGHAVTGTLTILRVK